MILALEIPGDLRAALKGRQSALRSLGRLERMIAEGQTPPARLLKPSGSGSAGEFAPYRVLLLHHAKLDFSG